MWNSPGPEEARNHWSVGLLVSKEGANLRVVAFEKEKGGRASIYFLNPTTALHRPIEDGGRTEEREEREKLDALESTQKQIIPHIPLPSPTLLCRLRPQIRRNAHLLNPAHVEVRPEHPSGTGEIAAEGVDEDFVFVEFEDDVTVFEEEGEEVEGGGRGLVRDMV
jgi:hypothetical protein